MARDKTGDGVGAQRPAPSDLPLAERRQKAEEAALRLLGVRERSAVEIKQRLKMKGYDAETITFVLDRLQGWGFQDDGRFARTFAEASSKGRGLAGRVIQGELRRRGIDKELAAQAATIGAEEERANALRLAEKRWRQLGAYPVETRKRRISGFLARRGYSFETVADVLETLAESPDRDD